MREVLNCSKCGAEILVTEALARPFIEQERNRLEQELRERRTVLESGQKDLERQRAQILSQRQDLQSKESDLNAAIQRGIEAERAAILANETKRIETEYKLRLDGAERDAGIQRAKIVELQNAELEFRKERTALAEEKREFQLLTVRKLDEERTKIRSEVLQEADAANRLVLAEKEKSLSHLNAKLAESQKAELEIRKQRQALEEEKQALDLELTRRMDAERASVRLEALREAEEAHRLVLDEKEKSLSHLNAKLAESQKAELEIRKQREALEEQKRALDLDVARRIDGERQRIREATLKEEDERTRLKFAEKDKVIDDLRKQAEELQRKSQQGSQQLQGEVQERELESVLRTAFPKDEIEPVATGRSGGDIIQKVVGPNGLICGTILWESKRTKDWSDQWLGKNKEDQRGAHASVGVIVSAAMPKGITRFDKKDDVWVSAFDCAIPLARALRHMLELIALAQLTEQGRTRKSDRVYDYINGQEFKHRVIAIAEVHHSMWESLEKERRFMNRSWAHRQKDLELLSESRSGLCGDLDSILCQPTPELEASELLRVDTAATGDQLAELSRAQV